MPTTLNSQISSSIQSFVAELTALVRTAALESVQTALGGGGGGSSGARRGPGRPKGSGMHRGPGRPKGSTSAKPGKPGRRVRRSSEDVEALAAKFLAYVKSNDGKRLEEIARAFNMDTGDLKGPAQKLLAAKAVKTTGAKRGTMYHVAGGGGRGAAKGKRASKKVAKAPTAKKAAKPGRAKIAKASSETTKSANATRAKAAAGTKAQPAPLMV